MNPNKTIFFRLLVKAYLLFVATNFLTAIFLTAILNHGDMAWTGVGIYLILTIFIFAPINVVVSVILFYTKLNRELLLSNNTIIAESVIYCVMIFLSTYYSKNEDIVYIVPYTIILPLLLIQKIIIEYRQRKRNHNSN